MKPKKIRRIFGASKTAGFRMLKPYPYYKDSGVEWIGNVPEGWELRKLSQSFNSIGSGTTPKSNEEVYYENGTVPWVITGDLNDSILNETSKKITKEAINDYSTLKMYSPNSLVIAMYGATIGKIALLNLKACVNQACCVLGKSSLLKIKYVFYWFLANKKNIISLSYGGGQPNISQDLIKTLLITIPSKKEQEEIIQYLDKKTSEIDKTIQKDKKLIELLKEKRTALINHVVTKGLDLDAKMKDSGVEWIGEIPEGWKISKIKDKVTVKISNVDKKSKENEPDVLLCNYTDVYNNEFITSNLDFMKATANYDQIKRLSIKKDDVIITKDSEDAEDIAVPAIVSEELNNVVCGYHLALLRHDKSKITGNFLFRLLQSKKINDQFSVAANVTRFGISTYPIKNSYIVVPSLKEQKNITKYLDNQTSKIDKTIHKIQKKITLMEEYKKSLIHHAVTGKIDVRGEGKSDQTPQKKVSSQTSLTI